MQSKVQIDELLKIAKEMEICYELNSQTPGLFVIEDEEEYELNPVKVFPELNRKPF